MTNPDPRCENCGHDLGPDDRYCSRCAHPTAHPDNAEITVVDDAALAAAEPADVGTGGTGAGSATSRPSAGANFRERLRHVLGEEFELLTMLGQGGFARVYKAQDLRLDRTVAIKVIQPELAGNEAFIEIFRNEGVTLAKLRHPGIVPIHDIRERGGLIYYIMPFVEGTTLEDRLERGRPSPVETRRILAELTDALAAAHRAKMVHLDIKPENVFLEGDHQKVLLFDFGIATVLADHVPESGGMVAGTPAYMSPEQAKGLPEIDHRSDIYSLGALGYRMIMGRPPYLAETIPEIVKKHAEQEVVHIRDINPTIPKEFADAIMKCLDPDPWQRFATAKELEAALESVTFGSQRDTASVRAASEAESPPVILIGGIAMIIGLLIGWALG